MGLFDGKKALIFGVANDRSIAWGIAQALHREGCELGFSYGAPPLEKRVRPLAESVGASLIEECNSREGFKMALDISAYSLVALTRAAEPLMTNGGAVLTMTYYGSVKVAPQYNVMGVAKAALEACVRYLASDLGPKGIRVNAISAGRTLVKTEDVGNTALWLLSDWSRGVTGEVVYVDAGWNIMGLTVPLEELG
jgi:enoyl-[acyl-carrier protein] reductase I